MAYSAGKSIKGRKKPAYADNEDSRSRDVEYDDDDRHSYPPTPFGTRQMTTVTTVTRRRTSTQPTPRTSIDIIQCGSKHFSFALEDDDELISPHL